MASFQVADRVITAKKILAGLGENGPFVCKKGEKGTVVRVEKYESDGIHVQMDLGFKWWFKPSQINFLEKKDEQ